VTGFLLDVNVLIALVHELHIGHTKIQAWFDEMRPKHWATCPMTEAGFVRIASNLRLSDHPVDVSEALQMLGLITRRPGHRFWPMDITFSEAVQPFRERLFGHRQVTDAYLLGLAIKNKGRLVTLDRGIEVLAGEGHRQHVAVLE
jgi:uncharacterized protein